MSNDSLSSWKTDTAIILLGELPLQDLDSATARVELYLSQTGGWIPEDDSKPTGAGEPATGETQNEAADSITQEELERVYNIKVRANVNIDFHLVQNLDPGLSDEDVKILIEESVEAFIEQQFVCTTTEYIETIDYTTETDRDGNTTTEERVTANDEVTSGDKLIDPLSISLSFARDRYDLDVLWNATYMYNEPGRDIVTLVEKYINTSYETIDDSSVTQYVVTINATTYELATGSTTTRSQ